MPNKVRFDPTIHDENPDWTNADFAKSKPASSLSSDILAQFPPMVGRKENAMKPKRAYRAKQSREIDLEYRFVLIEEGKTYADDGTTIFDAYTNDEALFESAPLDADTIIFRYPHGS
jgi:hypothetical protein